MSNKIQKHIGELFFQVQGSAQEPYEVHIVRRTESNLSAYCTCQAGKKGMHCKHRLRILSGNTEGLVSVNEKDVETVAEWVKGTDVETMMDELIAAEDALYDATIRVRTIKRALDKVLLD